MKALRLLAATIFLPLLVTLDCLSFVCGVATKAIKEGYEEGKS